jgi:hypothetical protein
MLILNDGATPCSFFFNTAVVGVGPTELFILNLDIIAIRLEFGQLLGLLEILPGGENI